MNNRILRPARWMGLLILLLAACSTAPAATLAPTPVVVSIEPDRSASSATPAAASPAPADPTALDGEPAVPTQTDGLDGQPGAAGIGDPYFPELGNGGYDALQYIIDLSVDVEKNSLAGSVTMVAIATQDLSSFNLDFFGFDIDSIIVEDRPADFTRAGGELTIVPAVPLAAQSDFETIISYQGVPDAESPGDVTGRLSSWVNYGDGIFVAGEPRGASGWYPVNEHPADKAVYNFMITVPKPYEVAANGTLEGLGETSDSSTFTWVSQEPIAPYLVTINIGPLERESEPGPDGIIIRNYFHENIPESTRRNFARQGEMIAYFNELFGPYPFEAYGAVVHDVPVGFALETQSLSFFGSTFNGEDVVVHELAHQWFGNSVSLSRWQDIWLNEGFATYASVLWAEHTTGPRELDNRIRQMYAQMAPGIPTFVVSKADLIEALTAVPYGDASITPAAAVEALKALLGREVSEIEIEAAVAGRGESFPMREVPELIKLLEFDSVAISRQDVNNYFAVLGLVELVSDAPAQFPLTGDPGPDGLFSSSVYQRGALTLHALRVRVGDEPFFEILRTFTGKFRMSNATTADFIEVAEAVSQQDLVDFFQAWLFEAPLPDIPEMDLFRADFSR